MPLRATLPGRLRRSVERAMRQLTQAALASSYCPTGSTVARQGPPTWRRPQRVPGDPAKPAPPRRPGRLHHQRDHHHLGPARQPTSRPRPPTPHRRTQRHTNGYAHRLPATDLPTRHDVNLNGERVTTQGGLSLRDEFCDSSYGTSSSAPLHRSPENLGGRSDSQLGVLAGSRPVWVR